MPLAILGTFIKKQTLKQKLEKKNFMGFGGSSKDFETVRLRNARPQAARTSQVHVFELGPKKIGMNEFM